MKFIQLFLFLQKKLKLDVSYFLKGGIWNSIQQIIGITSGLTVSYLFGHFVTKEVFGEYNVILSIVSMLTFLSLPGIDTVLIRAIGQKQDESLSNALRIKFLFSLLGLPVILGFAFYYFLQKNVDVSIALIITAVAYPFLNTFVLYRAFLTAKHRFDILAYTSIFSSLVFLITCAVSIFFFPSPQGLMVGYLLGMIIPSTICYRYIQRYKNNTKSDKHLLNYSLFLTGLSIIPWISGNLGNIILANIAGTEALAIFSVASRFFTAVQKNFIVFHKPITAKLAQQSAKQQHSTLLIHAWKFLCLGLILSFILWFATPILIHFFFTEKYQEAIEIGQLLSLALIPLPISWLLDDMIVFQKRKTPQLISSTIPGLIKIGLYFLLIPQHGVRALAWVIILDRFTAPLVPLYFLSIQNAFKKS